MHLKKFNFFRHREMGLEKFDRRASIIVQTRTMDGLNPREPGDSIAEAKVKSISLFQTKFSVTINYDV